MILIASPTRLPSGPVHWAPVLHRAVCSVCCCLTCWLMTVQHFKSHQFGRFHYSCRSHQQLRWFSSQRGSEPAQSMVERQGTVSWWDQSDDRGLQENASTHQCTLVEQKFGLMIFWSKFSISNSWVICTLSTVFCWSSAVSSFIN